MRSAIPTRWLLGAALVTAGLFGLVLFVVDAPEEAAPEPQETLPYEALQTGTWFVYGKTLGASGILNVTVLERSDEEVVLAFQELGPAGVEAEWRERVRLATREVVETTNPRAPGSIPGYDAGVGDTTWFLAPASEALAQDVRVVDANLTLEAGGPGAWRACGDVTGIGNACYLYDVRTGVYVGWDAAEQPGWTLIESLNAPLQARHGVNAGG